MENVLKFIKENPKRMVIIVLCIAVVLAIIGIIGSNLPEGRPSGYQMHVVADYGSKKEVVNRWYNISPKDSFCEPNAGGRWSMNDSKILNNNQPYENEVGFPIEDDKGGVILRVVETADDGITISYIKDGQPVTEKVEFNKEITISSRYMIMNKDNYTYRVTFKKDK
jgi:hypothetical protein